MSGVGLIKAIDERLAELELKLDVTRNADGIKTVLGHSQAHVDAGTMGPDADNPNTFLGSVVNDKRLNKGRATIVPTFWDGKKVEDPDEVIERAVQSGKKWPSSDSVQGALRLETYIHDIMKQQVAQ